MHKTKTCLISKFIELSYFSYGSLLCFVMFYLEIQGQLAELDLTRVGFWFIQPICCVVYGNLTHKKNHSNIVFPGTRLMLRYLKFFVRFGIFFFFNPEKQNTPKFFGRRNWHTSKNP